MKQSKPTYIDLFAGCGGLSLGLNQSGWKGLFAIEKSPFAFATLKHNMIDKLNHFDWPHWLDVKEHDVNSILRNNKNELISLREEVDLVVGGPPCQGFSTAGRRIESDSRNLLITSYVKFIRLVQPKMIFFENVKGFTQRFGNNKTKGIKYSEYVIKALRRKGINFKGYKVFGELINFAEYGVPQKRTRFILVGVRKDIYNQTLFPEKFFSTVSKNREEFLMAKKIGLTNNIKDAISDLLAKNGLVDCVDSIGFKSGTYSLPKSEYQKFVRKEAQNDIPDSHRFTNHSQEIIETFETLLTQAPKGKKIEGKNRNKYGLKKRGIVVFDENLPANTITSHPDDYVHYSEPRILTVRESARIQTFPDWFEFKEKYTTGGKLRKTEVPRYTQVGNAIPPLFGEQAGLALKQLLNGK